MRTTWRTRSRYLQRCWTAWSRPPTPTTWTRWWTASRLDYVNETPVHPARGFVGADQVRRNWEQIFSLVPDLTATVSGYVVAADEVWSEWQMSGTRPDGSAHLMRGVVIFTVRDGRASHARFYLEPVDLDDSDVDAAVRSIGEPATVIVVAGGTGRLGRLVVRGLAAHGERVRVLTRDPARATGSRRTSSRSGRCGRAATRVASRMRAPTPASSCRRCMGLAGPGRVSPAVVDLAGNLHLIDAADAAGADVVLTSILDAGSEHPVPLFRMKAAAEAALRASRVSWTIVRPAAFSELHAEILRDTATAAGSSARARPRGEPDQLRRGRRCRRGGAQGGG